MKTWEVPSRVELAAIFGSPIAWLLPWTVHGLMVVAADVGFMPEWSDRASINWYWAGFVCTPLIAATMSWLSVRSTSRATAVLLGTAISYALLAVISMIVVISVWTLVDGPFLEGF